MKYDQPKSRRSVVREPSEQLALAIDAPRVSAGQMRSPAGYKGLAAFHKYWGKKPVECLNYLVDNLTSEGDLVVDPFAGSGLIARECALRERQFIGIDINPFAVELARLLCDLPSLNEYCSAIEDLDRTVRPDIEQSYETTDGDTATHYLWDEDSLREIWIAGNGRGARQVFPPSQHDLDLLNSYEDYRSLLIRQPHFFHNSRINTKPELGLHDLFTGRALRNIDLILRKIRTHSGTLRRALLLTLTASVGQMSNMVFAITGRGKKNGGTNGKIEVGSWVIGYWRPGVHFEINVWNCFQRRARKLEKALSDLGGTRSFDPAVRPEPVIERKGRVALVNGDAVHVMSTLPDECCQLVLTDPPHSDRMPYLELSELWNSILDLEPDFEKEIVVSNARERSKTKGEYSDKMTMVFSEAGRILRQDGVLAVLFNARDQQSWESLEELQHSEHLCFAGCFPMSYSAGSVVQDNRRGAMKSDYVLLYVKNHTTVFQAAQTQGFTELNGWSPDLPEKE